MKKITFILFLLLTSGFSVMAQLNAGIKGGLNLSDMQVFASDNSIKNEAFLSRPSYHIGTYVNSSFSEHFGVQVEVLFSNKGFKYETDSLGTVDASLNYLNFPIMFYYRPGKLVEIEFGPEFGYLISGEDLVKSFDMGIDVGLRFQLSPKFNAGLRYSQGFKFDMKKGDYSSKEGSAKYSNSTLQVSLGFNLPLE
ncbi:MAG: PorT family protein [Chlorobi bacterium]|nr:PorT family protein [Chlorobiota bacterium]